MLPDGRRLGGVEGLNLTADDVAGVVSFKKEIEPVEGSSAPLNADTFGGKMPSEYVLNTNLESNYIKASVAEFEYGDTPLIRANIADFASEATHAQNATEAVHAETATHADSAIEANHAIETNHAEESDHATEATNAVNAANSSKLENKTINDLFSMMFEVEHPVGSLYLSSSDVDDPNTKWATYGINCVWELVKDVFLLGAGGNYELGVTGGEAEHVLTVDEMPSHNHTIQHNNDDYNSSSGGGAYGFSTDGTTAWIYTSTVILNTGGNQPHNNMPPYLVTNIWKRIS